jgi:hypothetical protein
MPYPPSRENPAARRARLGRLAGERRARLLRGLDDEQLRELADGTVLARLEKADDLFTKSLSATERPLRDGYATLAEQTLTAPPPQPEVVHRAEYNRLLARAAETGGDIAAGYRQRAGEILARIERDRAELAATAARTPAPVAKLDRPATPTGRRTARDYSGEPDLAKHDVPGLVKAAVAEANTALTARLDRMAAQLARLNSGQAAPPSPVVKAPPATRNGTGREATRRGYLAKADAARRDGDHDLAAGYRARADQLDDTAPGSAR